MAFTLVLTVVLGLCVGAVVADVLFGPEQPATSSTGSHGDRWDPWQRWLRNIRAFLGTLGLRARRVAHRGWHGLSRSFPEARPGDGAPPLDVLPPPVAPPFPPRQAPGRPNGYAPQLPEPPSTPTPQPIGSPLPVPVGAARPFAPAHQPAPAAPTHAAAVAFRDDPAPAGAPFVPIPPSDRFKAAMALVFFVTAVGAALAMILLAVGLLAVKALGGI